MKAAVASRNYTALKPAIVLPTRTSEADGWILLLVRGHARIQYTPLEECHGHQ